MRRSTRSEAQLLLQEARALELLADEAEVPATKLQEYWSLAADLITLVTDIEDLDASRPDVDFDDPDLLTLRRRVRDIASRLSELTLE